MTLLDAPKHCVGASVAVAGAALAATQLHDNDKVPNTCVAASIIGVSSIAASLAHHGTLQTLPPWYCIAGGVAGCASLTYAASKHADFDAVPLKCKIYTAAGVAAVIIGSIIMAKK